MYSFIRLLIGCIFLICSFVLIKRSKTVHKKALYIVFLCLSGILPTVLSFIPFENSFIKDTLCTPVRMLQIFICPAGIFVNMLHLYWVCGDAWAFRHVQTAWREDGAGYIGNMIWDFFNNIYAERYWIPLVVILAIVVYVYMLRNGYYEEVLFAIITLIIPLTGGVMSMCRFIVGSYVIFIGIYDYLADKKDIKLCATALVVIMEAFLIWLWFTAGVNAFTA